VWGAYVKLLILLAPRMTALAALRWSHLDPALTLWTTPHEFTKSKKSTVKKRKYLTPLPPLAKRMLKGFPKDAERVFASLDHSRTLSGGVDFRDHRLRLALIKAGDFFCHASRHTVAAWLENSGHYERERGLVLNHAGGGTVTAGYSHGYALDRKRALLIKWSDHVERLSSPAGVALLR